MRMPAEPQAHLWTRSEYYKMAEAGLFNAKRVELIEGRVIDVGSMGSLRATSMTLAGDTLRKTFSAGYFVQIRCPLNLSEISEPEPDVAVIAGHVRDYRDAHPTTAVLIIEVAETSLTYDRTEKASLYAKAGILDYWIVNLIDRQLEVHRNLVTDATQPFGFGYKDLTVLTAEDFVTPLEAEGTTIAVADLLP